MRRQLMLVSVFAIALIAVVACRPASAAVITYNTILNGPTEGTNSLGTGTATVTHDTVAHTMRVQASFQGLTGTTTAAHIHAPTNLPFAGTASVVIQPGTFAGLPMGVTSGSMDQTLDLTQSSNWASGFVAAHGGTPASAETAFFDYMDQGRTYYNLHTSAFPGGEIRGFLVVPEPGALTLLGIGAIAAVVRRRRAI